MKSPLEIRFDNITLEKRRIFWKILIDEYFYKYIEKDSIVLDVGAGFCDFINNISCKRKIALDSSSMIKKYANKDVKIIVKTFKEIPKSYYNKIDVLFMSNFLEHLDSKKEVVNVLKLANKLLKKGGKLLILQPNIDLLKERYWNRIDHNVALNGESVKEALLLSNFVLKEYCKMFLPPTFQTKMPINKIFIKIYLYLPSNLRLIAGQSFFVALKK
jgi:ubiquinone/menaquinone biosynthesis C-methylase UbiE